MLLHRLDQRRLGPGRGAVDLVGEDQLRKNRPGVELEGGALAVVYGYADDVGREHVAGELDAVEIQTEELCKHLGEGGLADAGQVLAQQVPAREQARERETDLALLAGNDFSRLLYDALNERIGSTVGLEADFP